MRDPARIDKVLGKIREYWVKNPDLRLGQIVVNAVSSHNGDQIVCTEIFYIEDEDLIKGI